MHINQSVLWNISVIYSTSKMWFPDQERCTPVGGAPSCPLIYSNFFPVKTFSWGFSYFPNFILQQRWNGSLRPCTCFTYLI